jgi:hypothetical protein
MTIFERVIALYDLEYFIKMGGGGDISETTFKSVLILRTFTK